MNYTMLVSKDSHNFWIAENDTLAWTCMDVTLEDLMDSVRLSVPKLAESKGLQTPTSITFEIHIEIDKNEKMILIDRNGIKWKSDGMFHTLTCDWNHDGDIYEDTVMFLNELNGNMCDFIHKEDLEDYKIRK